MTGVVSCDYAKPTLTIITVAGGLTKAGMETVLEGVVFNSTSDNPEDSVDKTIDFSVRDVASATSDTSSKTVTETRTNDSPTLAAINPPVLDAPNPASANAYENDTVGGDPFTFNITAVADDIDVDDDINNGDASNSLVYSLSNAPTDMTISNAAANPGLISWQPPITGTFGRVYGPITVQVVDGLENGAVAATRDFSLIVSPPDGDGDSVANYNDVCLTVADTTNADNDNDGTPGSDGGINDGGDVCDLDDDNDGMPDSFEDANGFDQFHSADAGEDLDGDGISNLQEYLDGTSPNQTNLAIDATGYLTPYDLVPPEPTSIHSLATVVTPQFSTLITPVSTHPQRPL